MNCAMTDRPQPGRPERKTLYVGLVPEKIGVEELRALFGVGQDGVKIVEAGAVQGRGKHAFVTFETEEQAREACSLHQNHEGMRLGVVKTGLTQRNRDEVRVDPQRISEQRLSELRRVHVVLCDPEYATNVGAVARLCGSFGTGQLAIVHRLPSGEEGCCSSVSVKRFSEDESAQHASTHGRPWLDNYIACSSITEAKTKLNCVQTVGFSARVASSKGRNVLRIPVTLASFADTVAERYLCVGEGGTRDEELPHIALVFGRESDGLHNNELAECDGAVTIPVGGVFNLSHSVAVALYEVAMKVHDRNQQLHNPVEPTVEKNTCSVGSMDDLLNKWKELALREGNSVGDVENSVSCLKSIFSRAKVTEDEILALSSMIHAPHTAEP